MLTTKLLKRCGVSISFSHHILRDDCSHNLYPTHKILANDISNFKTNIYLFIHLR